jgi:hypothetical protein
MLDEKAKEAMAEVAAWRQHIASTPEVLKGSSR